MQLISRGIPAAVLTILVFAVTAGGPRAAAVGADIPARPDDRTIAHVLNRIGFGPAPGDVERVRRMGLDQYIDQQLHPERIADSAMPSRLGTFQTLSQRPDELAGRFAPQMPEMREAAQREGRRMLVELAQQKVLRAIHSERQLEEVLVDFWFNHFNVFAGKGPTRLYLAEYERTAIRPHTLGKFRDLLQATAESPAMLFYLDNWQSAAPDSDRRPNRRPRGLNENYARELLELHTLGVDGGYTQRDVQEVARAFTGWTIAGPRQGGAFRFERRMHDEGEKTVLGHRIKAGGGRSDGEQVLDILATHPSTARFIAAKLSRRFVADEPPPALVERAATRFRQTGGDIREVVRLIVTSREFFAPSAFEAKMKTPLEFVASAVRTTAPESVDPLRLVQALRELGMAPYMCQPPTGYADRADAWINTGALLNRMNFAIALASGRFSGAAASGPSPDAKALALRLGSPEFQKR